MSKTTRTTKCSRRICKRRSADPKADDWAYIEFDQFDRLPTPKSGWWCRECARGLLQILEEQGVKPIIEPLH
jgi:hypothetical protein